MCVCVCVRVPRVPDYKVLIRRNAPRRQEKVEDRTRRGRIMISARFKGFKAHQWSPDPKSQNLFYFILFIFFKKQDDSFLRPILYK